MSSRISRRGALKAVGALAASPLIPILEASGQVASMPKRLLLFFTPHGTIYDQWKPGGGGTAFTLSPILSPLAAHQSKLVIIDGMQINGNYHPNCALAPHPIGMATLWTGSRVNDIETVVPGGNVPVGVWSTGPSIDQVIANRLNAGTPFRSLEVGVQVSISQAAFRTIYSGPGTALNPQNDPRALYTSLFSSINADAERLARIRFEKQSMIDVNKAEVEALRRKAAVHDRKKLDDHLTALRDLERQLQANNSPACMAPMQPAALDAGAVGNRPEVFDQQASMIAAAFACDLTRVASFQFSNGHDNVPYPWLNYNGAHHDNLSHDEGSPGPRALRVQINNWFAQKFAVLLDKLNAVREGNGTMLDNTMVVWGTEVATGAHNFDNVPFIVAGGGAKGVRTGRVIQAGGAFHHRLLVSMAQYMGVNDITRFGDLDAGNGGLSGLLA
ncbi:MAG: DUF1552 domain-containing protein [Myxococcaceae bacterium]|nr:DUF1552 domain-containing protein [Myxococcaceae bacterium]